MWVLFFDCGRLSSVQLLRAQVDPLLHTGVATGNFGYRLQHASKQDELLHNFRISTRGSIRKAPHVMTWVTSIKKLSAYGDVTVAEASLVIIASS